MKHYSKWDIESWQLTGRRSSYKYISRSKHWRCYRPITIERYLWTRPPSKIGSPLTIYARSIFFFISLRHFSLFCTLSSSLSLLLSPLSAYVFMGWLICCRRYRIDGSMLVFPLFPNPLPPLLNRSIFCPGSSEFWLRVVKQMFGENARTRASFAREAQNLLIPTFHELVVCCCFIAERDSGASIFNDRNNWISNQGSNGNINFCKWKLF